MAMAYDDDGGLKPNNQLEEGRWISISETSATTTVGELQTSNLKGDDDASIDELLTGTAENAWAHNLLVLAACQGEREGLIMGVTKSSLSLSK